MGEKQNSNQEYAIYKLTAPPQLSVFSPATSSRDIAFYR